MCRLSFTSLVLILLFTGCIPAANIPQQLPTISPTAPSTATAVVAENPPACLGANMLYHSQLREVLMTGCVPASSGTNDVHVLWGWNGEQWHRVAEGGPDPLVLGGAAYDEKRNVVVVYGGYSLQRDECNHETWEWDGETWSQKGTEGPTACDHLEMVYDASRGEVILFGGGDESHGLIAETWAWNGEAWTQIDELGPSVRAHFGFVYDSVHEQALLLGGYADQILDDFWAWKDGTWQNVALAGPGSLSHFGMALDQDANALIIFGGAGSTSTFTSLSDRTWKLADGAWSELDVQEHPSERGSPAMAYDPKRKRVVLYGGFASNRSDLDDTWEWDGSQWHCIVNCQ